MRLTIDFSEQEAARIIPMLQSLTEAEPAISDPMPAVVSAPDPALVVPMPMITQANTAPASGVPTAAAPGYTMDDLAKAGAALAQAGKIPDLVELLGRYGVQAVTQLKPEQFGAFATELRGLGAEI